MIKIILLLIVTMIMITASGCGVSITLGTDGPAAPTNLIATSQSNQVVLAWNSVTIIGNGTDTITYNVYRGTTSGSFSALTKIASSTISTYTDTTIVPGTTYYYQITAVDSTGESQASNQVSIIISQNTSSFNLNATTSSNRVILNWYYFSGATSYNIYRSITSGAVFTKSLVANNITTTNYTDASVIAGTTYYYMVTAITPTGESPSSNEVIATP